MEVTGNARVANERGSRVYAGAENWIHDKGDNLWVEKSACFIYKRSFSKCIFDRCVCEQPTEGRCGRKHRVSQNKDLLF